jgi:hypothetical protein
VVRISFPPPGIKIFRSLGFFVSDIPFSSDARALFRSAHEAAVCTETKLGVIGLGVGL